MNQHAVIVRPISNLQKFIAHKFTHVLILSSLLLSILSPALPVAAQSNPQSSPTNSALNSRLFLPMLAQSTQQTQSVAELEGATQQQVSAADVVRPFTTKYQTTVSGGDITYFGNNNLTCSGYDIYNTACSSVQNGTAGSVNDQFNMVFVDIDGSNSTFNSSSSTLSLPSGASILHARLYWSGAFANGATESPANRSLRNTMQIKLPNSTSYQSITADYIDSTTHCSSSGSECSLQYVATADVTSLVTQAGTYTGANVQATQGRTSYTSDPGIGGNWGGWTIVVAYANPAVTTSRYLAINDGLVTVDPYQSLTWNITGFQTPANTTFSKHVGCLAWDGDAGLNGDTFAFNGVQMSDAAHLSSDYFRAIMSTNGTRFTARTPNYAFTLAQDVNDSNAISVGANATSATLGIATSGDRILSQACWFVIESTLAPTATPTNTSVPATATPTNTTVPPTATATNTTVPPTATPTNTPTSVCTSNLLLNPSFESINGYGVPLNWSGGAHTDNTYWIIEPDGVRYGYNASGDSQPMYQNVNVVPGNTYNFTFYSASHVPGVQTIRMQYYTSAGSSIGTPATHYISKDIDTDGRFGGPYSLSLGAAPTNAAYLRINVSANGTDWAKIDAACLVTTAPTATPTNTAVPPTATSTAVASTPTSTKVPPTATPTNTPEPPTATPTNTAVPPTATPTNTAVPPTATSTAVPSTPTPTKVPPTATPTNTPVPPTATPTATNTPVPPASIGNRVWEDSNGNGIQDSGEPGVSGMTVILWLDNDHNGTPDTSIGVVGTDNNGAYSFSDLDASQQYIVQFVQPSGRTFTQKDAPGSDENTDSDANPTGYTDVINVPPGQNAEVGAGLAPLPTATPTATNTPVPPTATPTNTPVPPTATPTDTPVPPTSTPVPPTATPQPGTLSGLAWKDLNRDGVQDNDEHGLDAIQVKLVDSNAAIVQSTVTDLNGSYSFTNIAAGTYRVQFIKTIDRLFTTPHAGGNTVDSDVTDTVNGYTDLITLAPGETKTNIDAGLVTTKVTVGDRVWVDANSNGQQDNGEPSLANVTVNLLSSADAILESTVTDADGLYTFTNLNPGTYKVQVVKPAGYDFTVTDVGDDQTDSDVAVSDGKTVAITFAAGAIITNIDAGLVTQKASIGDRVWNDVNSNGLQDNSESGVANATVRLLDGNGAQLNSTTTNANGLYSFVNLNPGIYQIQFVKPTGYNFTVANAQADNVDSDADTTTGLTVQVTLAPGDNNSTFDAGLVALASTNCIGDRIWSDSNGDGIQNTGELGVANVTVNLKSGSNIVNTIATDSNGNYQFCNLTANAAYLIQVVLPSGYVFSPADRGANDSADSDVNITTGQTGNVTVGAGQTNGTVDAGLTPATAVIGNRAWLDLNQDGIQNGVEPGLPGVTVGLYDSINFNARAQATTDATGAYQFTNLPAGDYFVCFTAPATPADLIVTFAHQGSDAGLDSDADPTDGCTDYYTLTNGASNLTVDAGFFVP